MCGSVEAVSGWRKTQALIGIGLWALTMGGSGAAYAHKPFGFGSPPAAVLAAVRHGYGISEGPGPRNLYVFVDPNCPYCHRLFEQLQGRLAPAGVRVHWLVVGFLHASSPGKAAAILGARRPLAALLRSERGFRPRIGGGLAPVPVRGRIAHELAVNDRLLAMTGDELVPTLVYRNTAGRAIIHQGIPIGPHGVRKLLSSLR